VHDGKEVLVVDEERVGQIAHLRVRLVEMSPAEGKEPLLNRRKRSTNTVLKQEM
jgi:hypothetical protein